MFPCLLLSHPLAASVEKKKKKKSIHIGGIGNAVHLSFPSTTFEIFTFTLPRIKPIGLLLLGNVYFMGLGCPREIFSCDGQTPFKCPHQVVASRGGVRLPKSISGQNLFDGKMACEF